MVVSSIADHAGVASPPLVGTLGMFIVDTFKYIDDITGTDLGDRGKGEVLGGGGIYCAIGARIWLPPSDVKAIIDRGSDFARSGYQAILDHFARPSTSTSLSLWKWRDRTVGTNTTKALNIYRGDQRGFEYLTPKLRLDPIDIADAATGQLPRYLHIICSPDRASVICDQVEELDLKAYGCKGKTKVCWEPIPDSATPENLDACIRVMARISVLSPNHEEAAAFLSIDPLTVAVPSEALSAKLSLDCRHTHMGLAHAFRQSFLRAYQGQPVHCPIIVIRGGAAGSTAIHDSASGQMVEASIPAFHTSSSKGVVDVTGGGNSFMGGLLAWLSLNPEDSDASLEARRLWLEEGLYRGAVSASFIIEQLGLPTLEHGPNGEEKWNGQTSEERLAEYKLGVERQLMSSNESA